MLVGGWIGLKCRLWWEKVAIGIKFLSGQACYTRSYYGRAGIYRYLNYNTQVKYI